MILATGLGGCSGDESNNDGTGGGSSGSGGSGGTGGAGGESGSGGVAGAAGTNTGGTAGASGSAGSAGTSGAAGAAGAGLDFDHYGFINVAHIDYLTGDEFTQVDVGFSESATGMPACTITMDGPCEVIDCQNTGTPSIQFVSAGTVTLEGGLQNLQAVPNAESQYDAAKVTGALWNGGDPLSFSASGADVPAFDIDWVGPDTVTMTAPTGSALVLPAGEDLQIDWTGGTQGSVTVQLLSDDVPSSHANCVADATSGVLVIPAHVLQAIPHTSMLNVSVNSSVHDVVSVDAWDVELTVFSNGMLPSGEQAEFTVTLQ